VKIREQPDREPIHADARMDKNEPAAIEHGRTKSAWNMGNPKTDNKESSL